MIALDTNVLVRFLVDDDKPRAAAVRGLMKRAIADGETLFVSDVVLCEVVWVLSSRYEVARADVVTALRDLLRARQLSFAAPDQLARAVESYASAQGDFADHVIREHAVAAGCDEVATFDRALLKEAGFTKP